MIWTPLVFLNDCQGQKLPPGILVSEIVGFLQNCFEETDFKNEFVITGVFRIRFIAVMSTSFQKNTIY
jgi:hypothetical protein